MSATRPDVLGRGARWVRGESAFCVVVLVLLVAVVYLLVEPGRWGRSCGGVAVALLLGAVLRALVPTRYAGLLAVRSRVADTVVYLVLGGLILAIDIRLHG